MQYFTNAISSFISDSLPFGSTHVKLAVGMGVATLLERSVNICQQFKILEKCKSKKNKLVIFNKDNKDVPNPIFVQLQKYIIEKHKSEIKECDLDTSEGKLSYALRNSILNNIEDIYFGHKINIYIDKESDTSKGTTNNKATKSILLESKTADIDTLKEYINTHFKINKNTIKEMTIYNTCKAGGKDSITINWEAITVKSNRTIDNLVISENVQKEVIDDISWFMENELWYAHRGIPYKRGYILHGEPGTGKTSLIKCIANHYKIPVFSIQLDSIDNNDQMINLMTDINYFIQGHKYYILVFEDVDRSRFFSDRYYDGGMTIGCFLNVLDGIAEANGRIMFITGNNLSNITKYDAIIRPGRIDKQIEITTCDHQQIQKLINIFYENDIKLDFDRIGITITPANLIKIMQRRELEDVLNYIYKTSKNFGKTEEIDNEINEIIKPKKTKRSMINKTIGSIRRMERNKRIQTRRLNNLKRNINNLEKQKETIQKKEEQIEKRNQNIQKKKDKIKEMKKKEREKIKKQKLKEKEKLKKEKLKEKEKLKKEKAQTKKKTKTETTVETSSIVNQNIVNQNTMDRINIIADAFQDIRVLRNRIITCKSIKKPKYSKKTGKRN